MAVPSTQAAQPPRYMPQGYHRLARIMTREKTLAIFRTFDDILLITLMGLQADIVDLRCQYLTEAEMIQCSTLDSEKQYSYSFAKLRVPQGNLGKANEQSVLLDRMREKLKEYYDLLLQGSRVSALQRPSEHDLETLQGWLRDARGGDNFQSGPELCTWHDSQDPDFGVKMFASLAPDVGEHDFFTNAFTRFITRGFHHRFGERWKLAKVVDDESGLTSYDDSKIDRASSLLTTVIAAILPVVTILVLYRIQSTYGRIGATIMFTAVFTIVLTWFTKARRVEVLTATATFAAVEVVFIGSALGRSAG